MTYFFALVVYPAILCFVVASYAADVQVKKAIAAMKMTCPQQKGAKLSREYWVGNKLSCDFSEWQRYAGTTKACWAIKED